MTVMTFLSWSHDYQSAEQIPTHFGKPLLPQENPLQTIRIHFAISLESGAYVKVFISHVVWLGLRHSSTGRHWRSVPYKMKPFTVFLPFVVVN
jgi:hypothetical protein